jgi:hypothetical protein
LGKLASCLPDEAEAIFVTSRISNQYGEEQKCADNEACPRKYEAGIWQANRQFVK